MNFIDRREYIRIPYQTEAVLFSTEEKIGEEVFGYTKDISLNGIKILKKDFHNITYIGLIENIETKQIYQLRLKKIYEDEEGTAFRITSCENNFKIFYKMSLARLILETKRKEM